MLNLVNKAVKSPAAVDEKNENVLANSWTAPIKIDSMKTADFTNAIATIYIFNSGSPDDAEDDKTLAGPYSAYPVNSADGAVIPSMQSFSVYSTASSASLALNYKRLVYNPALNGTAAITPNKARRHTLAAADGETELRIYMRAESGYGDMVYMREREDFSEGFENGWDGHKVFGESVAPQLYAVTPDGRMAVNCVPDLAGTVLGFKAGTKDSEYTVTFDYSGSAEELHLYDTHTSAYTRVLTGNSYTFTTSDETAHDRFVLVRRQPEIITGVGEVQGDAQGAKAVKLIMEDKMYILLNGQLYDALGKRVK